LLIRPWVIEATHLPPVYPTGYAKEDVKAYKELFVKQIWNFLVDHDRMWKDTPKI
jgi:hypothetical protein